MDFNITQWDMLDSVLLTSECEIIQERVDCKSIGKDNIVLHPLVYTRSDPDLTDVLCVEGEILRSAGHKKTRSENRECCYSFHFSNALMTGFQKPFAAFENTCRFGCSDVTIHHSIHIVQYAIRMREANQL